MPHSAVDPSTSHEQPVDGVAQGSASAGAVSGDSGGEPASVKKATSCSYGASWTGAGPQPRALTPNANRTPFVRRMKSKRLIGICGSSTPFSIGCRAVPRRGFSELALAEARPTFYVG